MSHALRSVSWTALAVVMLASSAQAQSVAARASSVRPAGVTPAGVAVQRRGGSPTLTLYGGLASGDNDWNMGPALAASFNWRIADAPFNIRLDPYFAYHSLDEGSVDGNLWFLGTTGNLELAFRPSGTTAEPYIFGGGGFYFRNASIDDGDGGEFDDSDLKGAFGFGGGVRFGGFTLEARLQDIGDFTTVGFLVGFRLGG
jgi:hypothetical protein